MKSMEMPVVSVVMPVYNVAAYLPQCLRSLSGQSLLRIEILCVDDGSADCSAQIVREAAADDPRVVLLQQDHKGVSAARNLGIDAARGKYIAFIDSDDWADPDMLRRMTELAESKEADVVVCSAAVHFDCGCTDSQRRRRSLTAALTAPADLLLENDGAGFPWEVLDHPGAWPFIWNKLIRAELLRSRQIRFSRDLSLGEDGVFLQLLYQYAGKVVFMEDALYHYRYQRKDSATDRLYQHGATRFLQHIRVVETLAGELHRRDRLGANAEQLLRWAIGFLYGDFAALPACERRDAACRFAAVCEAYGLAEYGTGWTGIRCRRLNHLLETTKECTKWKRMYDLVRMKIDNRIIRLFRRA